jgi:hypothetical protein
MGGAACVLMGAFAAGGAQLYKELAPTPDTPAIVAAATPVSTPTNNAPTAQPEGNATSQNPTRRRLASKDLYHRMED